MNRKLRRPRGRRHIFVRRQLWIFCAVGAVALILVSIAAVTASRSLARSQALKDAERTTTRFADLVIAPLLPAALDGNGTPRQDLDRAINNRLADGYLSQITIWDSTGRVRYDSDPAQTGRLLPLPDGARSAITLGIVSSDFTTHPEVNTAPIPGQPGFVESVPPPDGLAYSVVQSRQRTESSAVSLGGETVIPVEIRKLRKSCALR